MQSIQHFEMAFVDKSNKTETFHNMQEKEWVQSQWDKYIRREQGDLHLSNVTDLRAMVTKSMDGRAYEITSGKLFCDRATRCLPHANQH